MHSRPAERGRHELIWAYDTRLADIVRTTTEPMIGRMRLAWWDEVISDEQRRKGAGDALVDRMRDAALTVQSAEAMLAVIDGWEALLDPMPLDDAALEQFAAGRGGGLFRAFIATPDAPSWLFSAGAGWALWDLSGHVGDTATAERAIALSSIYLGSVPMRGWPGQWKPLRLLTMLARHDAMRGRRASPRMDARQYARLLRIILVGR